MAKVDMDSIKPNSYKYKEEAAEKESKSKLDPIVPKDRVISTKKSLGEKISESFLGENLKEIGRYIFWDMAIPGIKNIILDTLDIMFFGRDSRDSGSDRSHTNYSSFYRGRERSNRDRDRQEYLRDEEEKKVNYRNIILKYRQDAEEVVDALYDRIENHGAATVADLLDLVGAVGEYTDNNWGWDRKQDICIRQVSKGFLIDVAPAVYLDN